MIIKKEETNNILNLLNKIDGLREVGLQNYIDLPQIAVMGDQSSGKSSVLESISGIKFPRSTGLCTRFATQIVMRKSYKNEFSAKIISLNNQEKYNNFNNEYINFNNIDIIEDIINQAVKIMCNEEEFSEDVLSITLNGPEYIGLTIIDLPGIIRTTRQNQSRELVTKVRNIVNKYLQEERTIILAIIPANVDVSTIEILDNANQVDSDGIRTIGVITKPDLVDKGGEHEIIELVHNKIKPLNLGYKIVCNPGQNDLNNSISLDEAKYNEKIFFESYPWNTIGKDLVGSDNLKKYLSEILTTHIKRELPKVKLQIKEKIEENQKELILMGEPLTNLLQKRLYYNLHINSFFKIIEDSSNGYYHNHDILVNNDEIRLRAILYNNGKKFSKQMGKIKNKIEENDIKINVEKFKGKELPGFINYEIFPILFNKMIINWYDTTIKYIDDVVEKIKEIYIKIINIHVPLTLKSHIIVYLNNMMSDFYNNSIKNMKNLLHDEKTPITFNNYYYDNINNFRNIRLENNLNSNHKPNEEQEIIDFYDSLNSYYKVAKKRYIDNVAIQCIERYIINPLLETKNIMLAISDDDIDLLLIEKEINISRREYLQKQKQILEKSQTYLFL